MMKVVKGDVIVLGLSHENLRRLGNGEPIRFKGEDIRIPGKTFYIIAGSTERSMEEDIIAMGFKIPQ